MTRTFKVLSAVLSYPTAQLQEAMPELTAAVGREALLDAAVCRQLERLMNEIATGDLYDLQERYVLLFDRTRSLSLHLTLELATNRGVQQRFPADNRREFGHGFLQLCGWIAQQRRQHLEGPGHHITSIGVLAFLGVANRLTSVAPPEQPLPKEKPQEPRRS